MKDCPKCHAPVDGIVCGTCGHGGVATKPRAIIGHDPICTGHDHATGKRCTAEATIFQGKEGSCRKHWHELPERSVDPKVREVIEKVKALAKKWTTKRVLGFDPERVAIQEEIAKATPTLYPEGPREPGRFPHAIRGMWYPPGDPRNERAA